MTSATPKVSVIIPCHNQGMFLEDSIGSVLAQTYNGNLEIIVIDDGSTDPQTQAILKALDKPKTRLVSQPQSGLAAARNTGIREAQGTYILPLDADDKIGTTYVEKAVQELEKDPQAGVVYCEAAYFGKENKPWRLPPYRFPDILLNNVIFCSAVFRKADWEAVGGYNTNMTRAWEDYDFWLSLIERGYKVHRIPETLFFYRKHTTSMVSSLSDEEMVRCYSQLFRNHPTLYTENIELLFQELLALRKHRKAHRNLWHCITGLFQTK